MLATPLNGFKLMVSCALFTSSSEGTITSWLIEPVMSRNGPSVRFAPALPLTDTLVEPMVTPPANEMKFSVGETLIPMRVSSIFTAPTLKEPTDMSATSENGFEPIRAFTDTLVPKTVPTKPAETPGSTTTLPTVHPIGAMVMFM